MSSSINLMFRKFFALPVIGIISSACASAYPNISEIKNPPALIIEPGVGIVNPDKVLEIAVEKKSWKCPECNDNEKYVLEKLQEKTRISDRNALATIMGNIKSESNFIPDICEGGARVPYDRCYSSGYGLIQWTSTNRYLGLGKFSKKYGYDPSSLEGQTAYMINEYTFQKYLPEFEGTSRTVSQYMVGAYYWLGWGIKGYRQQYAYDYTKKLIWS